jgi:hypothetical protein
MPGKLCYGSADGGFHPVLSKAYCEGRAAEAAGALIGTDPHVADSPASLAWLRGFADETTVECCDIPHGGPVEAAQVQTTHTHEHEHPHVGHAKKKYTRRSKT